MQPRELLSEPSLDEDAPPTRRPTPARLSATQELDAAARAAAVSAVDASYAAAAVASLPPPLPSNLHRDGTHAEAEEGVATGGEAAATARSGESVPDPATLPCMTLRQMVKAFSSAEEGGGVFFVDHVLTTYRWFTSTTTVRVFFAVCAAATADTRQLLEELIRRFNADAEDTPPIRAIRLRIINVMRRWVEKHWYQFSDAEGEQCAERLLSFLKSMHVAFLCSRQ